MQTTPPAVHPGARPADATVARFVALVNAHRAREGCGSLAWDPDVAGVAAAHSRDMQERGYFGHVSPDGTGPFDRLPEAGIGYSAAAENLAYGQRTADEVFAQLMSSARHRKGILSCRYTSQGVARYGPHWTQLLVRRTG